MERIPSSMLKEFQKSYQSIERLQKEWQETQNSSIALVESLLNLSEQLQCCEEEGFDVELLNDFPDVKKRLIYKILKALEGKMKKLHDLLFTFKTIKEGIESARNSAFDEYHKHTETSDVEMATKGSPNYPPLVLLLEWITDFDRWYKNLYEQKKDLLNNIRYNDKVYLQSFLQKWKDEACLYRVKGIMEQASLFLRSSCI